MKRVVTVWKPQALVEIAPKQHEQRHQQGYIRCHETWWIFLEDRFTETKQRAYSIFTSERTIRHSLFVWSGFCKALVVLVIAMCDFSVAKSCTQPGIKPLGLREHPAELIGSKSDKLACSTNPIMTH